jgi:hypothetical protein
MTGTDSIKSQLIRDWESRTARPNIYSRRALLYLRSPPDSLSCAGVIFFLRQTLKTFLLSPDDCTLILALRFLQSNLSTILPASHLAASACTFRGVEIGCDIAAWNHVLAMSHGILCRQWQGHWLTLSDIG